MRSYLRHSLLLLALLLIFSAIHADAQPRLSNGPSRIFLPLIMAPPRPNALNTFGFDLNPGSSDTAIGYGAQAKPKWTRAGVVSWSDVEPVRGTYRWEALSYLDNNLQRLYDAGIEPVLVVHRTPSWAQKLPGRICGPMKPEYIGDFAKFMAALVARYSSGVRAVKYWEIWNEPDIPPDIAPDEGGFGCWGSWSAPNASGAYYGEMIKQVYPAIKQANPHATVLAGALFYYWPDDTISRGFLQGFLGTGAGNSFDALSFHAYGEWGASDLLINKTVRIRQILANYGLSNKPLFATEIAAQCSSNDITSCPPNFDMWKQKQANYAARIYAEALALKLQGAFWFTLALSKPGYAFSQLVDEDNGTLTPRPAYYAFRNSALLLQGASYTGPPILEPPPDQLDKVQALVFQKPGSKLYVLWVPQTNFPKSFDLPVPTGSTAICTDHLDLDVAATYPCSDTNKDGFIPRAVNELPQYVEVFP